MPTLGKTKVSPSLISTGSIFQGTASYATTASYALNGGTGGGGTLQTGSIAGQTILYNFSSSQEATITGLSLSNNKWGVSVVEEWNSVSGDIYYPSCSLLMHFSGSDNSTTFTDSSPNNFTVTSNNGAKITSSISKFGSTSGFFDGTNDYVSTPNTVSNFGTDDFTIECWFYKASTNTALISNCTAVSDSNYFVIDVVTANAIIQIRDNSSQAYAYGPAVTSNQWNHIAVTRNSGTVRVFVNGVSGTPVSITKSITSRSTIIGGFLYPGFEGYFYGYIDELRITKGLARYTGSFTTQSVEFPNQIPQYETKYIGLIGGLNDTGSDYGVQKLDDTSLKIRKMSVSGTPVSGSPSLSSSVDRVYVNVLNYDNVAITASNSISSSYTLTASYALNGGTSITVPGSNDQILTSNGSGALVAESLLTFDGTKLSVLYQAGDEGGEILLSKPITNTTLTGSGITIDSYQNKIRFFEQGGAARGAYIDITACAAGVGTNLYSNSQLAKAWVNFNGTGTVAIRDSYNVSSITDDGVGQYRINFSTALNNSNYVHFISMGGNSDPTNNDFSTNTNNNSYSQTTTYAVIVTRFNGALNDTSFVHSVVFSN